MRMEVPLTQEAVDSRLKQLGSVRRGVYDFEADPIVAEALLSVYREGHDPHYDTLGESVRRAESFSGGRFDHKTISHKVCKYHAWASLVIENENNAILFP